MALTLNTCCDKSYWNRFVSASPQGSVFCRTPFLDALGEEYDLLFVEESGNPLVGAVIIKVDGQPISVPYSASMYQGILFDGSFANLPTHRRVKAALQSTEFLLGELERRFDRISFCLHLRFEDLRAFSWFHFHQPELGRFDIDLRYTGLVDLSTAPDFQAYVATLRRDRRRDYRQAIGRGLLVEESQDIDTLDHLHELTFERGGIRRGERAGPLLRSIAAAALAHDFGELLVCRHPDGKPASAALFLYDEECAYNLYTANDPAHRSDESGTLLLLEAVRRCWIRGLKWVDFCGINSPNRGDFKASFNAAPVPYFVVTWERPGGARGPGE